jgi:hypothetical protein
MKEDTYYLRTTGRVEIIQVDIPDTTINLEFAEIIAKAKATNACWSNLTFNLTKKSDFEYFLEAFGIFESYGSCPDVMVYSDSTIPFKPTQTGLYKFYITKTQNEIETDTMIVIGDN